MSLKVWLPLNGDLHNQGILNITGTNYNSTINTAGKIGSCYYFNGSNMRIEYPHDKTIWNDKEISMCMWYKWTTGGNESGQCVIDIAADLCLSYKHSSSGIQFGYWRAYSNNGTRTGNGNYASTYYTDTTWHHVVLICDHNFNHIYVDGVLSQTFDQSNNYTTNWKPLLGAAYNRITIGKSAGSNPYASGYVNDVRIYDHALSAAEVREISQGLVLHYKLNDPVGFTDIILNRDTYTVYNNYAGSGTTGSLTNLNEYYNGTVVRREVMTPNDTSVNNFRNSLGSHGVCGHRQTFLANTKYVFWIYYRPVSHTDIRVGGTASNISGWTEIPPIAVGGGWYRVGQYRNGTVTTDKTDNIFTSFYTPTAESGVPITIDWASPHLLAGTTEIPPYDYPSTIIQDSSGYNYNGIINGNIVISSDTNRYNYSAQFDGVDDSITVPYNTICPENIFTLNLWFKKDALGSKNYETLFGGPSGFEMDTRSGSATALSLYMASTRSGKRNLVTGLSLGNWYMITMTRDGIKEKYYVNGIFQSEIDAKSMPNGTYRIGAWASNTGQNYYGLISDFRIYCTALDTDAIRQLYEVSAKIDDKGNFHTFELNEKGSNKLTQTGILKDYIIEPYKTLPDGSHWKLMLFHYVDGGKNLFTKQNATYCNDFGLYSRLRDIDNVKYDSSKYEFYVIQDDLEYRWTQTNAPATSSSPGTVTTVSGYNNPSVGLAKNGSNTYLGYNSWWGACGCWTVWQGNSIPGFGGRNCTKYLALYARISNSEFKLANQDAQANKFIEF